MVQPPRFGPARYRLPLAVSLLTLRSRIVTGGEPMPVAVAVHESDGADLDARRGAADGGGTRRPRRSDDGLIGARRVMDVAAVARRDRVGEWARGRERDRAPCCRDLSVLDSQRARAMVEVAQAPPLEEKVTLPRGTRPCGVGSETVTVQVDFVPRATWAGLHESCVAVAPGVVSLNTYTAPSFFTPTPPTKIVPPIDPIAIGSPITRCDHRRERRSARRPSRS